MFRSCFAPSTKESITLSLWATSTGRVENVHEKAAADDLQFELLSRCLNVEISMFQRKTICSTRNLRSGILCRATIDILVIAKGLTIREKNDISTQSLARVSQSTPYKS